MSRRKPTDDDDYEDGDPEAEEEEKKKEEAKKQRQIPEDLPAELRVVLLADNHFEILGLPLPERDATGLTVWPVDAQTIRRHRKTTALKVHPDKHPERYHIFAAEAFECVTKSSEALLDDVGCADYVRKYIAKAPKVASTGWTPVVDADQLAANIASATESTRHRAEVRSKHFEQFKGKVMDKLSDRILAAHNTTKPRGKKKLRLPSSDEDEDEVKPRQQLSKARKHRRGLLF